MKFKLIFLLIIKIINASEPNNVISQNSLNGGFDRSPRRLFYDENYHLMKSPIVKEVLNTPSWKLISMSHPDIFEFSRDKYPLPEGVNGPSLEYDFVIVGGGSAGSALAARLSGLKSRPTVLLLEAGKPESFFTDIPMLAPLLQQTEYTWPYLAERQEGFCMGMENQRCFWPRGRALGGTSVINYMIYTRGRPQDWDRIAAAGNYGWSYKEVLPYYMKSERAQLKKYSNSTWHNKDGELYVQDVPFRSKLSKAFVDAGSYFGYRTVDYNSPDGFGFGYIQSTTRAGHRCSAAKAFLHPKKKRKNLHILTESRVVKLLIDADKNAYGVVFHRRGYEYIIKARKEVILSAGPIASPHLLMLSGIGPKEELEQFGIPVIQDLKVAQKVYDHISFMGLTFTLNTTRFITCSDRGAVNVNAIISWLNYGDGPISSIGGAENIGYIKTNVSDETEDYPDIELINACGSLASDHGTMIRMGVKLTDEIYNPYYKPIEEKESFMIIPMLLHPKSYGTMRLRSANPYDNLKIYPNYYTDRKDVETMIAALRFVIELVKTPPYQQYGAQLYTRSLINCQQHEFGTDEYWECAIRTITTTLHHQVASTKMGPASDPEAVVDPELRVHGINKLRVVDSGIIPIPTCAHTNAPAIMIGEKAADMLKDAWSL